MCIDYQCYDTSSTQAKSGRYISIKHEGEMHKRPGDSFQSSSLCGKVKDNLDDIAINISRTCQFGNQVGEHIPLKHIYLYCDKFVSLLH